VVLAAQLVGPVVVFGLGLALLGKGQLAVVWGVALAIGRPARAGKDDLLHPVGAGQFQQMQRAHHIHLGVGRRVAHALPHIGQRGLVGDGVWFFRSKNLSQPGLIPQIGLVEGRARRHIRPFARVQIVEDSHLMTSRQQSISHMAADKPGPAGDKNFHRASPFVLIY
jgi:hypothetical protein